MSFIDWLLGKKDIQKTPLSTLPPLKPTIPREPFEVLDGRQMLINAPYVLPKDTQEINRLDFQHFILRNVLRGNYVTPIASPHAILDVACGTGRWCEEMAQTFPTARVAGCDLVAPTSTPNYSFVQADVLKGLPFPNQSFDFVHQRLIFMAMPAGAWPQETRELVRVTRPGGWVELVESTMAGQDRWGGPYAKRVSEWITEASLRRGVDPLQETHLAEHLSNAGMQNVRAFTVPVPVGRWGGRIGAMMATNMITLQQALKPLFTAHLGVNPAEFDRCLMGQQQEWEEMQSCMNFDVVYGQRPM